MKPFEPGQILGERYQLGRVLAVGTFGIVWHAEHLALRSPVAVKVLDPLSLQGEARQRFLTEALAAAALRSPHVVQILDCGIEGETPYIVMELLEGESLAERLDRVSRLDLTETSRVVRHVARAIDRAQDAGIVHRDLKPGNVFIQANDGDEIVKVLDFGIARTSPLFFGARAAYAAQGRSESAPINLTPPGVILGTPHYMSPEQAAGAVDLDFRTDIWALGIIAYECLVGRPPHDGETVHEVLANVLSGTLRRPSEHARVPDGFDAWFARACARHPSDRYESGKQAADEFLALSGLPSSPSATSETAPLEVPLPLSSERARDGKEVVSPSTKRVEGERGKGDASSVPNAPRLPAGRARIAGMAVLGVGLLGASWLLLAGRFDEVTAMPLPRAEVATLSARLEPSSAPPESPVPQASEPRDAQGVTASESAALAPSVPEPSRAEGAAAPDRGEPAETAAGVMTPALATPAPATKARPMASPKGATTRASERRAKRTNPQLAKDCREPWFFDAQGLPRAKSECL